MPPCRFEIGRCWGVEDIGNSVSQFVWRLRVVDLPEREGFSPAVSVTHLDSGCLCPHS